MSASAECLIALKEHLSSRKDLEEQLKDHIVVESQYY